MNQKVDTAWAHYQAALKASQILEKNGYEAYFIGGAVRDLLLGELPKDFDLVTNATPEDIAGIGDFGDANYKDTSQAFGVSRVIITAEDQNIELEIATFRRDIAAHLGRKRTEVEFTTLEEDIQRRDFTINALAYDPLNQQLIDEVNGVEDLANQLVRFIGKPGQRIQEDPLRILRGIRLRNQLGFKYEQNAQNAIQSAIAEGKLADIARDRVRGELTKMLVHETRAAAIEDLSQLGALEVLLPEVADTKGVPQPTEFHSEGDVYEHTLLAINYLPQNVNERLVWATLLHDIGKPPTFQPASETGDRIRFNEHYRVGAEMARERLEHLRFPNQLIEEITWMIHHHLTIDQLQEMRPGRRRDFLSHPAFGDLLQLHKADAAAAWSLENGEIDTSQAEFPEIEKLWQEYQEMQENPPPTLQGELGIDGNWVMETFDVEEGPLLGEIMEELRHEFIGGEVKSEKDANKTVKRVLNQHERPS